MSVIIETSIGDFTVDLYVDERPRCCLNFLKLCKIKYYNFSLFHNVQSNLVAQTGDPTATGRGGESIFAKLYGEQARFFDMEVSPRMKHVKRGLVSMVNNGSGMHGSQFFITLAENLDYLDGKHTVFGEVAEGFEIIDKLNDTFCGEDNRPHQDIRIYHTIILDDPYDDPDNLIIPSMSPGPTEEMLNSDHIPCDADIEEDKGKTEVELAEIEAEKESKANTQILEMVGDLPAADVAPPENVLFVCKLNPVTTSEDLEIIFSRFGQIVNCDVIKDSKTGESLQYAFVEFDNAQSCENAYFKMDNVLIDDRRIHVDFSQSVSKLKWKGKGKGVDILASGDAPVYVLKNQQRQDNRYDLVYEEDVSDIRSSKKNKLDHVHEQRSRSPRSKSTREENTPYDTGRKHKRDIRGGSTDYDGRENYGIPERGRRKDNFKDNGRKNWERSEENRKKTMRDRDTEDSRENKLTKSHQDKRNESTGRSNENRTHGSRYSGSGSPRRTTKRRQSSNSEPDNNIDMKRPGSNKSKKERGKHETDSSGDRDNTSRNRTRHGSESDSSPKKEKKEKKKKKERDDSSCSEIEIKKHKSKKSKKHKQKHSSNSVDNSLETKKKKRSRHNRSDTD